MSDLLNLIKDTFPANGDTGVPLRAAITVTLEGTDYDEDSITDGGIFIEGPDTDQFVGAGMATLQFPDNVSQGDMDDFFASPGRKGIVQGTVTVETSGSDTLITFTPSIPLAASTEFVVNLSGIYEADGTTEIDGYVTFTFTSGSGSIEEVPTEVSSSVLSSTALSSSGSGTALSVVNTTPEDNSVENDTDMEEIIVQFNKALDPDSISGANVLIGSIAATDHPGISVTTAETIVKTLEVDGSRLKIKI